MFELTPSLLAGLPKNGPTDPIEFYRRPIVGKLFLGRINMGLGLIPPRRYARALEVGYGAGAVMLTLAPAGTTTVGLTMPAMRKVSSGPPGGLATAARWMLAAAKVMRDQPVTKTA